MEGFFERHQMGLRHLFTCSRRRHVCHWSGYRHAEPARRHRGHPRTCLHHGQWIQNEKENARAKATITKDGSLIGDTTSEPSFILSVCSFSKYPRAAPVWQR